MQQQEKLGLIQPWLRLHCQLRYVLCFKCKMRKHNLYNWCWLCNIKYLTISLVDDANTRERLLKVMQSCWHSYVYVFYFYLKIIKNTKLKFEILYTDKNSLIYKEIHKGSVGKSFMTNCLIYG
jgi:hypothetical protein